MNAMRPRVLVGSRWRPNARQVAIAIVAVLAATLLAFAPPTARPVLGAQGTLYAVTGAGGGADDGSFGTGCSGGSLSSLYTLDPTDASVETGPTAITISGTQIKHVNGIAVHPTTGVLYGVMNGRLAGREYLADEFSVADIACVGWVKLHDVHQLSLETWPNVKRWYERMLARPGVQRGFDAGREALETQPGVDAEAKVHLFGHARK